MPADSYQIIIPRKVLEQLFQNDDDGDLMSLLTDSPDRGGAGMPRSVAQLLLDPGQSAASAVRDLNSLRVSTPEGYRLRLAFRLDLVSPDGNSVNHLQHDLY